MCMNKIRKDLKVDLYLIGDNGWEIRDQEGNVLKDCEEDYFIYLRNVALKRGNVISGRYCGVLTPNSPVLDSYCKDVTTDGKRFTIGKQIVRNAKMVAVNNKTKIILILA